MTKRGDTSSYDWWRPESDAAQYVDGEFVEGRRRLRGLHAVGIGSNLRDELGSVWEECREPNWDGYGALPVVQDTLRNAYQFLESLPTDIPAPSIGAEPDGDLSLEWHRSPRRTMSVSVSADAGIHYAALVGANRSYGTEALYGEVPKTVLDLIRRVLEA